MVRALIAVEGLRCELALRLPNLRSVAGDIRIEATPGHRLELPEDLLAVLGWDWVRLERKRDAWVSKLRLRGVALARSARAEAALQRAAPHLARVLEESPARFHQRHLAARWGVTLRRSIPTATALGMIGGALLLPRLFDAQARAGLWMALHYVPIALLALSFRLQEMSQFEIALAAQAAAGALARAGRAAAGHEFRVSWGPGRLERRGLATRTTHADGCTVPTSPLRAPSIAASASRPPHPDFGRPPVFVDRTGGTAP